MPRSAGPDTVQNLMHRVLIRIELVGLESYPSNHFIFNELTQSVVAGFLVWVADGVARLVGLRGTMETRSWPIRSTRAGS